VNGLVKEGKAVINQTVMLGPDRNQLFRQVVIKGIHVNRVS
jgi:GTPase